MPKTSSIVGNNMDATYWRDRTSRMWSELGVAVTNTDKADIESWALAAGNAFGTTLSRRVTNIGNLIEAIGMATSSEAQDAAVAYRERRLTTHLQDRRNRLTASTRNYAVASLDLIRGLGSAIIERPTEVGPHLFVMVLTSILVSGGPDGDGGVPDLDLELGIGFHRSIFSHSILAGAALETGFLSLVMLIQLVHKNLPAQHDSSWDAIARQSATLLDAANRGASLGLAYHLLVDGLAQPAPYHGLHIELPIEIHQTAFAINGMAEGLDATNKGPVEPGLHQRSPHYFDENKKSHEELRRQSLRLDKNIRKALSPSEANLLTRYGRWLSGLASGELAPYTIEQANFVEVVKGNRPPTTKYELAWVKYCRERFHAG